MDEPRSQETGAADTGRRVQPAAQPRREVLIPAADRLKAIGLMCVAVALFSALDTSAKYLATASGLPVVQIAWSRFLGQFAIMLSMLSVLPISALLGTRKLKLELLRSLLMVSTTAFNFLALRHLQLDQSISVVFMAPLLVALLAGPLLGEWVGLRRFIAIAVGFIGVLIVVHPGVGEFHYAFIFAFGSMLAYAFFMLLTRFLAAHDAPLVMLFYSVLLGAFGLAPFALWNWVWPPDATAWLLLSVLGIFGGVGHYLFIHAYRLAPASSVAPFIYIQMLTMVLFGFTVFGDVPDVWTLIGAAVIIASGIYLLNRERSVRKAVAETDPI
ncbi:DMT family transporter [Hyphomicrobium sulfonivorans]|uniref:DMT family transporter n=1 Tax=Hyphomicrobium sulfonivorans TaxID=121290 RepID=UPI00156EAE6F|nr:DMT family transporter [Hyphomicrobium sulfonivorans]MBI1651041.1 DMT family transporter [Hyphomicrobium sulfonivorans]NSL72576.1 EamA/RhaT family transporter [Hyphomicrobium sulfonivorans]